jgi:hypothetical protein
MNIERFLICAGIVLFAFSAKVTSQKIDVVKSVITAQSVHIALQSEALGRVAESQRLIVAESKRGVCI